jgi:hypothetical protein
MNRTATLFALLGLLLFPLSGCPTGGDDDDSAGDDDDTTGDDDDATGDDDDATGDDDDATGDDDDTTGDDDDSAGDDDDTTGDDDDSAGDDDDSAGDDDDSAGDDDDSAGPEALAVYGLWDDTAGFHSVNDHAWLMWSSWGTSRFDISQSDAAGGWLSAQNAASNDYYPSLWSKFEWFETGGQLYYCQVAYDAADESTALSATSADQGDVNSGCGGFAWSTLDATSEAIEVGGVHVDSWATDITVTDTTWTQVSTVGTSIFAISQFDNADDWAVAQNDAANTYNPNLWSRVDWTTYQGDLYVCQTAYDAADEATAVATTAADATDPTTAGCGGFSWSLLTP